MTPNRLDDLWWLLRAGDEGCPSSELEDGQLLCNYLLAERVGSRIRLTPGAAKLARFLFDGRKSP